jgi:S-DNA-T family DNA segregation ATPase FtsK/SpoIIIE
MVKRKKKKTYKRAVKKPSLFLRLFRKKEYREPILPEAVKPWVTGILLILFAFFTILSFFNLAGIAGRGFLKFSEFLVGKSIFLVPLTFLLGGLSCFGLKKKNGWSVFLAIVFLCIGVCGIFAIFEFSGTENLHFNLLFSGRGGWIGNIIAWPLFKIFGSLFSKILFSVMILISGLIFWYFLYLPHKKKKTNLSKDEFLEERKESVRPIIKKVFAPKFQVNKIEEEKEKENTGKEHKNIISTEATETPGIFEPEIKPIEPSAGETSWNLPPLKLLSEDKGAPQAGDVKTNAEIIEKTLENFNISVKMSEINIGPTVTQYTLKPAEGVKLSKITALNNNLSLALAAHPLRMEAPIPGKSLVGVEVPNKTRTLVRLRNLFTEPGFQNSSSHLLIAIGRDVVGSPFFADLSRMPHFLVAGSTGSGKTVCLSTIILSLLYRNSPKRLRIILVDPKRVEFINYNGLSHLLTPVIYDVQKTLTALKWLIEEMERRFQVFAEIGARNIDEYNQKIKSSSEKLKQTNKEIQDNEGMAYIVLIIDELADLMASKGREMEAGIVKLAQKSRAVGIHLILATQRPSVEVITGLIKVNITSRIAFQVASQVDSRTILDTRGADKLLGLGDSLFISAEISKPKRIQGAYVASKEIEKVVDFIIKQNHIPAEGEDSLAESIKTEFDRIERIGTSMSGVVTELDPVYQEAKRLVLETRKASASFLQRKLRIGYARAARLLDTLEEKGIVSPADGAKPREVFFDEDALLEQGESEEEEINNDE